MSNPRGPYGLSSTSIYRPHFYGGGGACADDAPTQEAAKSKPTVERIVIMETPASSSEQQGDGPSSSSSSSSSYTSGNGATGGSAMMMKKAHGEQDAAVVVGQEHGIRKHCGVPWMALLALAVLIGLLVVYFMWRHGKGKKPDAQPNPPINILPIPDSSQPPNQNGAPRQGGPSDASDGAAMASRYGQQASPAYSPRMTASGGGSPPSPAMARMQGSPLISPLMFPSPMFQPDDGSSHAADPDAGGDVGLVLSRVTFDVIREAVQEGMPALVIYSMSGCGHCEKLKAQIQQLIQLGGITIPIFWIERSNIPADQRPSGYPYVFVITGPNSTTSPNGKKPHTAYSIAEFLFSLFGPSVLRQLHNWTHLWNANQPQPRS